MLYRVSALLPIVLAAVSPSQDVDLHASPQGSQWLGAYVQAYVWNGYGWVCVAHQLHPMSSIMEPQQYEFSDTPCQETTLTDGQTRFIPHTQDVQAAGSFLHEENYPQQYGFFPYDYDPQMQQWFAPETLQSALDMNVPAESNSASETTRGAEDAEAGIILKNFCNDPCKVIISTKKQNSLRFKILDLLGFLL